MGPEVELHVLPSNTTQTRRFITKDPGSIPTFLRQHLRHRNVKLPFRDLLLSTNPNHPQHWVPSRQPRLAMESPPKRMTRARAAAKATEPKTKTTKIVTAAAKAKSTATSGTKSANAKRKTRADESDDEDEIAHAEVTTTRKATRGRSRRAAETEEPPKETTKATRGRPAKKQATEATKAASAAPAKATRGRPRKIVEVEEEKPKSEPANKTTRAAASKPSTTTATTKSAAAKKSVKFEEPDKENVEPANKKDAKPAGIRGRPARRGGATAARSTRKATDKEEKKPLSPKKVTQMPMMRDEESEDELAGSPHVVVKKPLQKNPVKPPGAVKAGLNLPEKVMPEQDDDATINVNNAILNAPDLTSTALSSPAKRLPPSAAKDSMKSPARRMPGIPFPGSALKSTSKPDRSNVDPSPSKGSLLFSAAKRPTSPIKGLNFSSPTKSQKSGTPFKSSMLSTPAKRNMPGVKPLTQPRIEEKDEEINASPAMKTFAISTPAAETSNMSSEKLLGEAAEAKEGSDEDEIFEQPIKSIKLPKFSGRLSAILPRDEDPFASESEKADEEQAEDGLDVSDEPAQSPQPAPENLDEVHEVDAEAEEKQVDEQDDDTASTLEPEEPMEEISDPMDIDTGESQEEVQIEVPPAETHESEALTYNPNFALRQEVLEPALDGDETLEPKSPAKVVCLKSATSPTKRDSRRSTIGLTALTEQFGSWNAVEAGEEPEFDNENMNGSAQTHASQQTPMTPHFFKDEMAANGEEQSQPENATSDMVFTGLDPTTQDIDLAQEAERLSQVGSPHIEQSNDVGDDTLSDASEEYGDENEVPIDPAIMNSARAPALITPVRAQKQTMFNTTTKVPLKPADNSTPSPLKKRSFTAPRPPPQRASGLSRSTTLPSLSPTKERRSTSSSSRRASSALATTPTKGDATLELATPGRSRESVNPNLLQGAVVFVDVHTSEGADASGIFMELLTQMGARCRKTWDWNDSPSATGHSNRIGITHVVYKDGGKRTLEKVRRTKGLVQCVGVNWVLE